MLDATQILDGTLPNTGAAITVTRASTNVLDFLVARDIGAGNALYVNVLGTAAFTAAGAATLTIDLEASAAEGSGYEVLISSGPLAVADLILGWRYGFVIPQNQLSNATAGVLDAPGQYYRLNYTVATGPMTAGSVMAWLSATPDRNAYYSYPRNYTAYVDPDQIVV